MQTHVTITLEGDAADKKALQSLASQLGYDTLGQFIRASLNKKVVKEMTNRAKKIRERGYSSSQSGDAT